MVWRNFATCVCVDGLLMAERDTGREEMPFGRRKALAKKEGGWAIRRGGRKSKPLTWRLALCTTDHRLGERGLTMPHSVATAEIPHRGGWERPLHCERVKRPCDSARVGPNGRRARRANTGHVGCSGAQPAASSWDAHDRARCLFRGECANDLGDRERHRPNISSHAPAHRRGVGHLVAQPRHCRGVDQ
jgi:hypothetical protein